MGARIGWGELVIILIIALIVLGPERLPQAGRALGKAIRGVKKFIREAAEELDGIEDVKEIQKDLDGIRQDIRSMGESLEKSVAEDVESVEADMKTAEQDLNDALRGAPGTTLPEGKPAVPSADHTTEEEH